jgi:gas vesicle structural protein
MTSTVTRRPASGTLAEVVDIILDKGLVIDAYVRVSLVGIELLTVDVRVVVASVDTYLHFAEATNRLDLRGQAEEYETSLPDLLNAGTRKAAKTVVSHVIDDRVERTKSRLHLGKGR